MTEHCVENISKWSRSWSRETHWELLQNFRWGMTMGGLPVEIQKSREILDKFWAYTCQDVLMVGQRLWEKRRCQGRHCIFWAEPKDGQNKISQTCSRRMLHSILLLLFYLFGLISCVPAWCSELYFYIETSGDASVWLASEVPLCGWRAFRLML